MDIVMFNQVRICCWGVFCIVFSIYLKRLIILVTFVHCILINILKTYIKLQLYNTHSIQYIYVYIRTATLQYIID